MRLSATLVTLALAAPLTAQTPTVVFLVRHGEVVATGSDPALSVIGKARASALTETLANAGINAVLSAPYIRTKTTVEPLAAKLGLEVTVVPMGASPAAHAQALVEAVRKLTGKAILISGLHNTINLTAAALGAPKLPDLCTGDYDQLFILELMPTGPPRFVRSRYGELATDKGCEAMR